MILPANEDLFALTPIGWDALYNALKDGAGKYRPGHWRTVSIHDHLKKAEDHIAAHLRGDWSEPHLEHAITRLVCALALTKGG